MAADEVVQLYVRHKGSSLLWPDKELKAFKRISLAAGESANQTIEFNVDDLRYWDEVNHEWALESGAMELLLGSSSDDIRLVTEIMIK